MSVILEVPALSEPPTDRLVTGEELLAHPEWGPCELIRGKVVPVCRPNTVHGGLMAEITFALQVFTKKNRLGRVICGDAGVYLERRPDTVRGPDVYFVAADRIGALTQNYLEIAPDLCVEIVSPNDRWSEIEQKVNQYLSIGVKLIWVIDPGWKRARVFRLNGTTETVPVGGALMGENVLPGFELSLGELFAAVEVSQ